MKQSPTTPILDKYPNPEKTKCKSGCYHSIGIYSGICSNCKIQFWGKWIVNKNQDKTNL